VRVEKTTICGTDLHILKGDMPAVTDGRILGHEGVGVVEEAGTAVSSFKKGDRVLISCITSCGKCDACKKGMYSHCADGGWILGHLINGTQAEYVRIPHADNSLHHVPDGVDEDTLVMLSDILPTGFEVGVLNGKGKPGDTVAIVGGGPVGLAALLTAQFYSPAELIMIDLDENRLEVAKELGPTRCVNSGDGKAVEKVMALTGGKGVDVAIEAVGIPATFDLCQDIVAAGGASRQRGRAWQARFPQAGEALDPQRHDHDGARRHQHDADAAQDRGGRPAPAATAHHPRVQARRPHEGVRHLCERSEGEGAQGHHPAGLTWRSLTPRRRRRPGSSVSSRSVTRYSP
jgi:threonine dehydrogenase-like Zn-dependent dehydrogenase